MMINMFTTQGKISWKYTLLIFVLIVIVGGGIFWFVTNQQTSSDWKTYTNEDGGYSFQYPKEWNAVTNKYNSKNALFGPGATNESGYGGVEYMGTLLPGQSLKDFIKEFNKGIEAGSTSETTAIINEQDVVISILPKASMEPTQAKNFSFEIDSKVFGMYLMYKTNFDQYPEDEQRLNTFNQMIATFTPLSTKYLIAQVMYICNNNKTINASFYKGKTKLVKPGEPPIPSGSMKIVLSDGRSFDLPQTISADGSRYANTDESFIFWSKGDGALVLENNIEKNYRGCIVSSE